MASVIASSSASLATHASLVRTRRVVGSSSPPLVSGLPLLTKKGKIRCSMEANPKSQESNSKKGIRAAAILAAVAATTTGSSPAMALVDSRLGTEGTGLPLGLDNNILGWIIVGVFGTIWALYFTWAASLEEDEESGLSL